MRPLSTTFKKRDTCLHSLGGWRQQPNDKFPLLFVTDKRTETQFLVDTGATRSLFPVSTLPEHTGFTDPPPNMSSLSSIGGGQVPVVGLATVSLDLGFSKLFTFQFHVTNHLSYGILGADFLAHHRLGVNLAFQRLSETLDVERSVPDDPFFVPDAYAPACSSESDIDLLPSLKNEFPEVFDCEKRSHVIKHSVVADVDTSTETPIHSTARRLNPEQFVALKAELARLLEQGILERSQSPWASPIVMVRKKTDDWRLCADFTNLNKVLKTQKYALPNINDFAALAYGCKYFSALDVADAYYNVPVNPNHRHKLMGATPLGNYCYNFLPMGLASSSCYYQRLMNEAIGKIPQVFCYLDDIIIMSKSLSDHKQTLCQVFLRLKDHGLVVRAPKCIIAAQSLSFLGYQVSSKGLAPLPIKVAAVRDFKLPRTKKQLKTYLGMYQFYARFVKNYAQLLQPLHTLAACTPPRRPISWDDKHIQYFEDSKDALANAALLAFPDPSAQTELVTDASGNSIGCVLQQSKNGVTTPLAFWSKGLTKAQENWSVFEKELFACYASLKHFRYYLEAKDFVLLTDHRPIVTKFHNSNRASSPRQERFFDFIGQMTNDVRHVEGSKNVADIFSRPVPPHSDLNAILTCVKSPGIDYLKVAREQKGNVELQKIKFDESTSLHIKEVPLGDTDTTILCDDSQGRLRPVIPNSMRFKVFSHFHSGSHPGIKAGIKLISRMAVWYDMRRDITRWTRECQECARAKVHRHTKAPLQAVTPPPRGRFTNVYVDLTGPLPISKGHSYIMVVVDRFTRFFQAIPLSGITAEECVDAFIRHWVSWFGCPTDIYSDRGRQFTSSLWADMCCHLGAKTHQSTAYHPQAQGLVERLNRTLKTSLKCHENPSEWFDQLPWTVLALRNMPKEDLANSSPSELTFGEPVRLPGEFFDKTSEKSAPDNTFADNLTNFISRVQFSPARSTRHSSYIDPKLLEPSTTHVYIRIDKRQPPLHPTYMGPYQVVKRHPKYFEINTRTHIERISIDRLKPAHLSLETLNRSTSNANHTLIRSPAFSGLTALPPPACDTAAQQSPTAHFEAPPSPEITTRGGRHIRRPLRFSQYDMHY